MGGGGGVVVRVVWEASGGLGGKDWNPSFGGLLGSLGGRSSILAPSIGPQA